MLGRAGARYVGVDLGAESGRVVAGDFDGERLGIEVVHRFENRPVRLPDGLHWDVLGLFRDILDGLRQAGDFEGVGIDTWGCDYALLDGRGRMLGLPFHYRDPRTSGMSERAFSKVSQAELYARTGIQHLRFNTVFQLLADAESGLPLERADRIALVPDLLAYWLTGNLVNEATIASTSSLADPLTRSWATELARELGLPGAPFECALVEPGAPIGEPAPEHGFESKWLVRTVAAHDTASAFVAAPLATENVAVISSGTWSLVGLELDRPQLGPEAAAANLSNEWGIDGTTRLLRNVMGLWLLQECRRQWERNGLEVDYAELERRAGSVSDAVPLFDPDLDVFFEPGDMPARIAAACRQTEQPAPRTHDEMVRSILLSLACKYRLVVEELARVSGRRVEAVHVVGGGSRNGLLCRLTADVLGVPVLAGPVEATALGNILVQLRAAGAFASRAEMRRCVSRSFEPVTYEPTGSAEVYERFLAVTARRSSHVTVG